MDALATKRVADLRAERFLGESRVLVKQLEKAKARNFREVLGRTKACINAVERAVNSGAFDGIVADFDQFWDLYRSLSELSDEIDAYHRESRAIL